MRFKKIMSAVAASALAFGLSTTAAQAAPQPIQVDENGVVTGGHLQNTFGAPGPYKTTQTASQQECNILMDAYSSILYNTQGVVEKQVCWGTFPYGTAKGPVGVEYTYPSNIQKMGKLPVVIVTPGIIVEPGLMEDIQHFLASHGYLVVTSYSFLNWTGNTIIWGAADLYKQSQDKKSPFYGHIDASKTILTGHSAGGGSTVAGSGWLLDKIQAAYPGMKIRAAIPLQPGPSFFFQAKHVTVPTFVVLGSADPIVSQLFKSVWQKNITKAPLWMASLKGASHGKTLDGVKYSANAASILAFASLYLNNDPAARSIFYGPQFALAKDAAFEDVYRNALAEQAR